MKPRRGTLPTRERILNEVERLIARKGVYGFKLRDVAERLGVKVPAIYKHYTSREDVLVEVSRRYIALLGTQFHAAWAEDPAAALRSGLNRLVKLEMSHPFHVRLALADLAAPLAGMQYVRRAAKRVSRTGPAAGPLAAMFHRLRGVLRAGERCGRFRRVRAADFYRTATAALLARLVFPDDELLLRQPTPAEVRGVQRWLWEVARGFLAPRPARGGPS